MALFVAHTYNFGAGLRERADFGLSSLGRQNRGPFKPVGQLAQVRAVSVLMLPC